MNWVILLLIAVQCSSAAPFKNQTVREKNDLRLVCNTKAAPLSSDILWMRGEEPIFIGDQNIMANDDKYTLETDSESSVLLINNAEPIDSATYHCQYDGDDGIEELAAFKVSVQSEPTVSISPELDVYDVIKGEQVVLNCHARGNPQPAVNWQYEGKALPRGAVVERNRLTIKSAEVRHAGKFTCKAKSEAGEASKDISLRVNTDTEHEKPWVQANSSLMLVNVGATVEVKCSYDGRPAPQLDWYFNNYKINFKDPKFLNAAKFAQRGLNSTIETLQLKQINDEQFGDYKCEASNQIGSASYVIHVTGRPGPPDLQIEGSQLSFSIRSKQDIIEYRIFYRRANEDGWEKKEDIRAHKYDRDHAKADLWVKDFDLSNILEPGVRYQVQVRARNSIGWGPYASEHVSVEIPRNNEPRSASSVPAYLLLIASILPCIVA